MALGIQQTQSSYMHNSSVTAVYARYNVTSSLIGIISSNKHGMVWMCPSNRHIFVLFCFVISVECYCHAHDIKKYNQWIPVILKNRLIGQLVPINEEHVAFPTWIRHFCMVAIFCTSGHMLIMFVWSQMGIVCFKFNILTFHILINHWTQFHWKCYWRLFLSFKLTMNQHCFR